MSASRSSVGGQLESRIGFLIPSQPMAGTNSSRSSLNPVFQAANNLGILD
jgi:hypothetical protein